MTQEQLHIINTVKMDDYKYAMMNNGINLQAPRIIDYLGLNMFAINRFRDAGFDKHTKSIWILTRSGSTNHFGVRNEELKSNPMYSKNYDDPFDSTYEIFIFKGEKGLDFKHVGIPNLAKLAITAADRMASGKLNELEKKFLNEHFSGL
jgi:hypothetical protein